MTTMKKKFSQLLIFALLTLTLAACGSSKTNETNSQPSASPSTESASPTKPTEPVTVDIANGVPPWQGHEHTPVKIRAGFAKGMTGIANQFAISKGWYKDAGFDLELIDIPNPVGAFGAGEVDIADGDPGTYLPSIVNGLDIKIISNLWRSRGAYWIIANPDIKTFEDLKGKKVGTGVPAGGIVLTLMEVLSKNGIDPKKDVELISNGTYQAGYGTFASGEVDATIIHQPYATLAEKEGKGHVLAKTWEYMPEYHTGVIVASQKLIDEQPEVVERLLEVYFYANEYAKTHFDEFLPWAANYFKLDQAIVEEAINAEIVLWENNPIVDVSRLQVTEDMLTKYGMHRDHIKVDGTVNNTFAEKVAKTLKLGIYANK
jgi:NitT/TauT family transport system substrate-binding protein